MGKTLPGTALRLAADGEILASGPQIFQGYWQAEQATSETLTPDGWLRTGDIGAVDDEGYLRITGRKKELIVTAAGKNVAPAPLEDRLRAHALISQAVVVGDARAHPDPQGPPGRGGEGVCRAHRRPLQLTQYSANPVVGAEPHQPGGSLHRRGRRRSHFSISTAMNTVLEATTTTASSTAPRAAVPNRD